MKLLEVTIASQSYKLMVNSYWCIHLLNTRKYCDNTRQYCGNTYEYWANTWKMCSSIMLVSVSITTILVSFRAILANFKPWNTCKYWSSKFTHRIYHQLGHYCGRKNHETKKIQNQQDQFCGENCGTNWNWTGIYRRHWGTTRNWRDGLD